MTFSQRVSAFCLVVVLSTSGCVMIDSPSGIDICTEQQVVVGSGRIVNTPFGFTGFTRISISHAFKARISKANTYSVTVRTDDNVVEYLKAYKSGDEIFIGLENNSYRNVTTEVIIETPDLDKVNADGAVSVWLDGFVLDHAMGFTASGSSAICGTLTASEVAFTLSGSSTVELAGSSSSLSVNGSGATSLNLFDFPVKSCRANLSGASSANVNVSDILEVALSGASIFRYKGNPTLRVLSLSGGSIIQKVG